jgi:hypothetical protein
LEIVPNFSYLGITFSKSGSFNAAKKDLVNKGMKAMYEVLKKGRLHNLSIQCQPIPHRPYDLVWMFLHAKEAYTILDELSQ